MRKHLNKTQATFIELYMDSFIAVCEHAGRDKDKPIQSDELEKLCLEIEEIVRDELAGDDKFPETLLRRYFKSARWAIEYRLPFSCVLQSSHGSTPTKGRAEEMAKRIYGDLDSYKPLNSAPLNTIIVGTLKQFHC